MNKKWLAYGVLLLLIPYLARAEDNAQAWAETCTHSGGAVVNLTASFDNQSIKGLSKAFCFYNDQGTLYYTGLETLSAQTPSIAATFVQKLALDPEQDGLPLGPSGEPALTLCKTLSGTSMIFNDQTSGFFDKEGQSSVCVFGDGSAIDSWALIHLVDNGAPALKAVIKSPPLPIKIPDIYAPVPS